MTNRRTISYDFSNFVALVTGGTSGIGLGIARTYQNAGAKVLITGTKSAATEYAEDLSDFQYFQTIMEDVRSIDSLIADIGQVDILVNNAGTAIRAPESHTPIGFERNIAINLNSVYRMSHGFLNKLKTRPGSIINIASMTSYAASPRVPAYGASKAAIVQLTKTLSTLYAEYGIRVNAIAPGWIETPMTIPVRSDENINRPIVERTPMGRWGKPEEIAGAALFLSSPDAAGFVTGVTIPVDGGYSAN